MEFLSPEGLSRFKVSEPDSSRVAKGAWLWSFGLVSFRNLFFFCFFGQAMGHETFRMQDLSSPTRN